MSETQMIYKIVPSREWRSAETAGQFSGSGIDLDDGFIHFSAADQAQETADRHFSGIDDLLLVAVDPASLGDDLKWEPSRGGDLFPHLYARLRMDQVVSISKIHRNANGRLLLEL